MKKKQRNSDIYSVTFEDILRCKQISEEELESDLRTLLNLPVDKVSNSFAGNRFIYHYQFPNILKCRRGNNPTLEEIWNDEAEREKLIQQTIKRNRGGRSTASNIFECFRINKGAVVIFKAGIAKYVYARYGAKKVLDPTAGWGGRMLGAWALGIDYVGIDTNLDMRGAYCKMIGHLRENSRPTLFGSNLEMVWENCLNVDFEAFGHDLILTSPPYGNIEVYPHMAEWDSWDDYYDGFMLPLFEKCATSGAKHIALNVSAEIYDEMVRRGVPKCIESIEMPQQMGGKRKRDYIYVWKC